MEERTFLRATRSYQSTRCWVAVGWLAQHEAMDLRSAPVGKAYQHSHHQTWLGEFSRGAMRTGCGDHAGVGPSS